MKTLSLGVGGSLMVLALVVGCGSTPNERVQQDSQKISACGDECGGSSSGGSSSGDLEPDPGPADFTCQSDGCYQRYVSNGQCVQMLKKECGGAGGYSMFINPCPAWKPNYYCNAYGDCWCYY